MGAPSLPLYGEDFASVIEASKKLIKKFESGKYTAKDVKDFAECQAEILKYVKKNKN